VIEAEALEQKIGDEGPHHVERAVGEVDDRQHAEDDRKAQTEQRIKGAVDEPDQQLAVELRHADGVAEYVHQILARIRPRHWALARTPWRGRSEFPFPRFREKAGARASCLATVITPPAPR